MSDFLTYFPEGKEFVGYRKITFSATTISYFERIAEESLSTERSQRKVKEENEHKNIMEFLTQQIIDRGERAKRIAENQNALIDDLKREQKQGKVQELSRLQEKGATFNNTLNKQRKAKEEEGKRKERKLRERKRRLKEFEEKLERQKAKQRELEREKRQEGFNSREQELLRSIRETELSISKLKSMIETNMDLIENEGRDTNQLLNSLKETQQSILQKEQENLNLKQRCALSERLREETEKAYIHEAKERLREEAEMKLSRLESALRIADSNLIRKWQEDEFDELRKNIVNIRSDFENGDYETIKLSIEELHKKIEAVERKAYADERLENQREYVANSFLKTLRHIGYDAYMFQQDPNDLHSVVVVKGTFPSGNKIELTIPLGEIYSIKFSGTKEERCCSEESTIRKVIDKFGIGWRALEPLRTSSRPDGYAGARLLFKNGNKKVELTNQLCG